MQNIRRDLSVSPQWFLILLLMTVFCAVDGNSQSLPVEASSNTPEVPTVNRRYCLEYMLSPDENRITREIDRLESVLDMGEFSDKRNQERIQYAAGILHTYRYIRSGRREDAMQAKELLEAVESRFTGDELFTVHIGMAHAFVASVRTVFGVGDLKKMQTELQSLEIEHPDWFIRFLRGTTLVEVGRALPSVFSIREIKKQAVEVGKKDLEYVLSLPRLNEQEEFDIMTYDFETYPVPVPVVEKAQSVLTAE